MTDKMFLPHIDDLAATGAKRGYSASKFLTAAQVELVCARYQNRKDVLFSTCGGFENAERQIAIFRRDGEENFSHGSPIAALKLTYRRQDTLSHRDVLGAVLALGIERDTIGDILVQNGCAYLVCLSTMAGYIMENLQTAGRVGLTVSEMAVEDLPPREEKYEETSGTVSSLRLDSLVAFAFRLSREGAQEAIAAGLVQLRHQTCTQSTKTVEEGSVISLRGSGRVRLLEVGGLSGKGRQRIVVGRYL